jgi:hypothetical protein
LSILDIVDGVLDDWEWSSRISAMTGVDVESDEMEMMFAKLHRYVRIIYGSWLAGDQIRGLL